MPVEGIEQLAELARELKEAGERGLTKELYRGVQRSGRPLKAAAKEGALESLPKEGGLAEEVAGSRFSVKTALHGRNPRITLTGVGRENEIGRKHDLRAMDRGRLRHPRYGHRKGRWYTQMVRPGWFTQAIERKAPAVREELQKAVDEIVSKLGRGSP